MVFKCKNCDGNMIYSPEHGSMFCPHCEGTENWEQVDSMEVGISACPNCYGQLEISEYDSATKCPYCDNYIVLNERVEGEYTPKMMIRFQMGKEKCKDALKQRFKKQTFAPTDFLSEARLNGIEGTYVPFWFYDYKTSAHLQAEGIKTKTWTTGNIRHTETSYYNVVRDLDMAYEMIPADASIKMPDPIMDLMAPYDYSKLENFAPQFMSGFFAEKYNMPAEEIEYRAKLHMEKSARATLKDQSAGYDRLRPVQEKIEVNDTKYTYGLLPVWMYDYKYKGKEYPFYVNGQTGKIVGNVPISKGKVFVYSATLFVVLSIIWTCLVGLLV